MSPCHKTALSSSGFILIAVISEVDLVPGSRRALITYSGGCLSIIVRTAFTYRRTFDPPPHHDWYRRCRIRFRVKTKTLAALVAIRLLIRCTLRMMSRHRHRKALIREITGKSLVLFSIDRCAVIHGILLCRWALWRAFVWSKVTSNEISRKFLNVCVFRRRT